jgi:hypothetical protein
VTDVVIVITPERRVELRLGPESGLTRERLGMTAWVALEALVLAATPDSRGAVVVATSARDLGGRLGIGKDRAAAALAVLRDAGLLVPAAPNAGRSGRFVAHRYEIRLPVSRPTDAVRSVGRGDRAGDVRRAVRERARLFEVGS